MKLLILFFNIVWIKSGVSFSYPSNLQMIVDVIISYEQPTSVVASVCWPALYRSKLTTMLSKEGPTSIRYLTKMGRIDDVTGNNHLLYLIDLKCQLSKYFLSQASANKMFSKTYRWLVLGNNNDTIKGLKNLDILVDAEFIVAEEQEHENILLSAVYKIHSKSEWIKEFFGSWTINNGLSKGNGMTISKSMRRKDLRRTPITFSFIVTDNSTRTGLSEVSYSKILVDPAPKSTYRTLLNLYDFINATKEMIFTDTWGYLVNGSWTGMIGDIQNGRADLCGCMTFITEGRMDILEYSMFPSFLPLPKIVFRQPPLSYQYNLFLLPFTPNVWYCLGAFFILISIILYINTKWDIKKYEVYNEDKMDQTCLPATWSDIILFALSAVFQQGSSNELKGTLGRLVMFLVFLAFLFLYTSYSANIVVLLQSTSDQIRTITDLANSKLDLGIEDIIYNKYYYSESYARDPVRKAFYESKISPKGSTPKFMSLEEGVKTIQSCSPLCACFKTMRQKETNIVSLVGSLAVPYQGDLCLRFLDGFDLHPGTAQDIITFNYYFDARVTKPFAFAMNTGSGYWVLSQIFQEHEKCGLVEIDYIQASKPWFCSKKYSPYSEIYRIGFIRIEEHGLSDRNNRLILAKKPICNVSGGNFVSVDMIDFYPALIMLLYGMLLASILFVLENVVHRRQNIK